MNEPISAYAARCAGDRNYREPILGRPPRADTVFNMTIGLVARLASFVIVLMMALQNWAVVPYAAYIIGTISTVVTFEEHFFRWFRHEAHRRAWGYEWFKPAKSRMAPASC